MFWFKNLLVYRLTKKLDWSPAYLQNQLLHCEFHPCLQSEMRKFGWINPLQDSEQLHFSVANQVLLVAQKEEKILPAQVINKELAQRIEKWEQKENRKLKKIEKQSLKEDVIASLLPRAFSKTQHTALWIDGENQLIYVDAASSKRAEEALGLLRKSLGSLPVLPLSFAHEPTLVMTDWLANNNTPNWLNLLEEAELVSGDEAVIRCRKQNLENEEIQSLLSAGKNVSKLSLEWEDNLRFVLNEDCSLKRLKFAESVREKNNDILKQDIAQRFDADFVLMTGILSRLTENLLEDFGGEKVRT